ncbi:MAG: serine hydrolase domain-containing protein [Verrucomicrobiota bacterium]
MKKIRTIFLVAALTGGGSHRTDAVDLPLEEWSMNKSAQVDAIVREVHEGVPVPGIAVGIVLGDELVYGKGFGFRRLSDEKPAGADTLFHVGSVSKPITATLLAALMERGVIALDDPVAKHLPESVSLPTYDGAPVELTVRHLATHSSGLPRDPPNRRNVWYGLRLNPGQAKPYSVEELYVALGKTKLLFEPGSECSYSNFGYGLLGHVLEMAGGKPLEELMKQVLFKPLGMKETTVTMDEGALENFATHYWHDDRRRPRSDRPRTEFGEIFGHGGVVSSVEDLARFVSFQFSGKPDVLSLVALDKMRTGRENSLGEPLLLERDGVEMQMCIGWRVQEADKNGGIVNHSGEMDGHSAYVAYAPRAKLGVIVLANLGGARRRESNPTAALQVGVRLKESILYPALGWKP